MRYPDLKEEKKLWKKGFKRVACLDEAGRGPIAGPVVAVAVMLKNPKSEARNPKQYQNPKPKCSKRMFRILNFGHSDLFRNSDLEFGVLLRLVNDSKKLLPKKREEIYKLLIKSPYIKWGTGRVSEKVIDKINILEATKLAMKRAVRNLEEKLKFPKPHLVDFLILDGKMKLDLPIRQKSIIKADEKVFSCAAASIIAKIIRDRIMMRYHRKYPQYRFDLHKGYGTKLHRKMLKKYGPCKIHRKSFGPIAKLLLC